MGSNNLYFFCLEIVPVIVEESSTRKNRNEVYFLPTFSDSCFVQHHITPIATKNKIKKNPKPIAWFRVVSILLMTVVTLDKSSSISAPTQACVAYS